MMKQISARLEDLQKAYPTMPTKIRDMIQKEVAFQTESVSPIKERTPDRQTAAFFAGFSWKKAALPVLAATMILGVTAFATGTNGFLRIQRDGKYALRVGVTPAADAPSANTASAIPAQIPRLSLKAGYIPEGYCSEETASQDWDVYPKETPYQNGLCTAIRTLGEEITEEGFPLTIDYVLYSEEIPWQDRTALYVELQKPYWDAPMKRIYIPLPEYWQGLIVYAWENTSKNEMIKYAENLEIIREEGTYESAGRLGWVEDSHTETAEVFLAYGTRTAPTDRVQKSIHPIGETVPLPVIFKLRKSSSDKMGIIEDVKVLPEWTACVKKVEVFDDFSPLDPTYLDAAALELLDENQKLKPNLIRYMSKGNGVSSPVTEMATQIIAQKLVYVTIEYTNISGKDLEKIVDRSVFCLMIEEDNNYVIYDRALEDGNPRTDYIAGNERLRYGRMVYFDASIGDIWERCVIPEIKAGESVTVHIAGVVNEDELDKLYLSFAGGSDEFSERTLAGRYVDLRQ